MSLERLSLGDSEQEGPSYPLLLLKFTWQLFLPVMIKSMGLQLGDIPSFHDFFVVPDG